jgi:phosphatidylserine decarboxylase
VIEAAGLKFIIPAFIITIGLTYLAAGKDSLWLLLIAVIFAIVTLFLTFFYRNPSRDIPEDNNAIVSIADGTILSVQDVNNDYIGKGKKVSIFLSVLDVHINRVPIAGQIDYVKYIPGKFFKAFVDKASEENEQTEIGMIFGGGKLIFKQIAGILARRIVCRLEKNQSVATGEIFGLIHFGSRAELFLPSNVDVVIKAGEKVKGGETIIARIIN